MAYPISDQAKAALRNGSAITYTVDAYHGGSLVSDGTTGMRPTGGTITDTTKAGVRRVLTMDLDPMPGRFDALSPIGTTLNATARVTLADRSSVDIPMGVFDVDSQKLSEGGGGLSLTAPDKWVRVKRARFVGPGISTPGIRVVDQIAQMIRDALGASEPVTITATSAAIMGVQTWESDRDKAIIDLATGIGAWVYFDRTGLATVADIPTSGPSADWLVDASAAGVLTELDRSRDRSNTYNVVLVTSSGTDSTFDTQIVGDTDPASPTYAGTPPYMSTSDAGPFGVVPYYYNTPLPLDNAGALETARTILSKVTGLASQVSLGQVPNPAVDAFDVIDVLPPKERYDIARVLERHIADTVSHPLSSGSSQQIEGRSTRVDDFT